MIKGDRLKALRKEKGLTQEKLGEMLGVKKSVVCLYEKEKRNPSVESIIDMVEIFDVSADYLLGTECLIKQFDDKKERTYAFTKEEVDFILELKKYNDIYEVLIPDCKRGIEVLKKHIG